MLSPWVNTQIDIDVADNIDTRKSKQTANALVGEWIFYLYLKEKECSLIYLFDNWFNNVFIYWYIYTIKYKSKIDVFVGPGPQGASHRHWHDLLWAQQQLTRARHPPWHQYGQCL